MSEIIAYKADWQGKAQECEQDIIFDHDIDDKTLYAGTAEKIRDMGRNAWHVAAGIHLLVSRHGKAAYHELYEMTGYAVSTLETMHRTYIKTREHSVPGLSFWVHKEAALLPPRLRDKFLADAQDENWTVKKAIRKAAELRGLPKPEPKNKLIAETSPYPQNNNNDTIDAEFRPDVGPAEITAAINFLLKILPQFDEAEYAECVPVLEGLGCSQVPPFEVPSPSTLPLPPIIPPPSIETTDLDLGEKGGVGGKRTLKKSGHVAKNPPTIEEISAYGSEIELPLEECEKFLDSNLTKGWKVNGTPMVDWKAALRTWKRNWKDGTFAPRRKSGESIQTRSDRMLKEAGYAN